MKKLLFVICLISSVLINAQAIGYKNFDEKKMKEVLINTMKGYTKSEASIPERRIYNFIERKNGKMSPDSLDMTLNRKFMSKYDEKNVVKAVGILSCVSCDGIEKYEDIAKKCIKNFDNGENSFMLATYGKDVNPIVYYNKETNKVYIFTVLK